MASEPLKFRVHSEVDFDGTTKIDPNRTGFQAIGPRYYMKNLTGPAGQISGDFFGFFSEGTPKLVGAALSTFNPQSVLRMIAKDSPDVFRVEVDLTPKMVYVPMYPGDTLAIYTRDGGRVCLDLVVTELSEHEHVQLALQSPPEAFGRRFRLIRGDGTGFNHQPLASTWHPTFTWDPVENLLVCSTIGNGPIPARDLSLYPKFQGCYLSVRYSGIGAGDARLYIVDNHLREADEAQADIKNVKWSKVQFVSHDDLVGLWSPDPAGGTVVCDIELVRVQPDDRLRGRYERGL